MTDEEWFEELLQAMLEPIPAEDLEEMERHPGWLPPPWKWSVDHARQS